MIVDSSAIVAVLLQEPEAKQVMDALADDRQTRRMSAATLLECAIVIDARRNPALSQKLDLLVGASGIEIVPFTADHMRLARQAYRDFGKGSGHPAQLNFGDCFAYALALSTGEPLLCKGSDFRETGIDLVVK